MQENKNFWNKTSSELTVADIVKVNLAIPAIMVGSLVAVGAVYTASEKLVTKFRTRKQLKHIEPFVQ